RRVLITTGDLVCLEHSAEGPVEDGALRVGLEDRLGPSPDGAREYLPVSAYTSTAVGTEDVTAKFVTWIHGGEGPVVHVVAGAAVPTRDRPARRGFGLAPGEHRLQDDGTGQRREPGEVVQDLRG